MVRIVVNVLNVVNWRSSYAPFAVQHTRFASHRNRLAAQQRQHSLANLRVEEEVDVWIRGVVENANDVLGKT